MLSVFFATLSPMLVMFLCIVIGFILNKKKILPENTATVLSKMENCVLMPALIVNNFLKYCTVSSLSQQYTLVLYCALAILLSIGAAYLFCGFFHKDPYQKNIYKYSLTFANAGFMGTAIVPAILGETMLYDYLLFNLPVHLAVYTWGTAVLIPTSAERKNPLYNLINPTCVALIIGIVLGLSGAQTVIPSFITSALDSLAACMGPIAMVLTGFVIGNFSLPRLMTDVRVYIASLYRLILWPAALLALLWLLGADSSTLTLALFAFATPLGLNTVIFPSAYGGDTSTGAAMATISHTLSVITIPLMYAALTALF